MSYVLIISEPMLSEELDLIIIELDEHNIDYHLHSIEQNYDERVIHVKIEFSNKEDMIAFKLKNM